MFVVRSSTLAQWPPAFAVYMLFISSGVLISWPSPMLPKLEADDSPFPVTSDEGSWIVSVFGLGGILSPVVGLIMDRFGRKPVLIAASVPIAVHWILTIFATSPAFLISARVIGGFNLLFAFTSGPVYIGEIAQEDIRGVLGAMMDLFYNLGYLFSYCVGPYTSFNLFSMLCCIFPIIFLLLMLFIPETPYYLLKKNKRDEAQRVLMRLRWKSKEGVKEELNKMEFAVKEQNKEERILYDLFSSRASRRGLLITIGLVLIQQFSGTTVIISYTQFIFDLTPGLSLSSSECAMIVGAMKLISGIMTVLLVDRIGRRILLLLSTIGCSLSLLILGIYLYLNENNLDPTFRWLPLFCLVVYELMYCLGLSAVPVILLGEIFASNVKDFAVSLSMMATSISYFTVTKIYQIMTDSLGGYSTFWFFSAVAICGSVFVYFLVPETKGKSFETIIKELNDKPRAEVNNRPSCNA